MATKLSTFGHCRDCRYWTGTPRAYKLHKCLRLSEDHPEPGTETQALAFAAHATPESPGACFVTLRTFGCTAFSAKGKADAD